MPNANVVPGTLPGSANYCPVPVNYQQMLVDFAAAMTVPLPALAFNSWFGDSQPTDWITYPLWFRTTNGGTRLARLNPWIRISGTPYARHPIPEGPYAVNTGPRFLFFGAEPDIWAYDGGDGTDPTTHSPTETTGAVWQADPLDGVARALINSGTLPIAGLIKGDGTSTGGEEQHKLLIAEMPSHNHAPPGSNENFLMQTPGGSSTTTGGGSGSFPQEAVTGSRGGDAPHNNMQPYIGIWLIRRTFRKYVTGPL